MTKVEKSSTDEMKINEMKVQKTMQLKLQHVLLNTSGLLLTTPSPVPITCRVWHTHITENVTESPDRPRVATISRFRRLCSQVPPSVSSSESYSYRGLTFIAVSIARACASIARRFANTYSYMAFIWNVTHYRRVTAGWNLTAFWAQIHYRGFLQQ